jgi:CrcB protein
MNASLLFATAAAGAAGTVARLAIGTWVRAAWPDLPLATAIVNVLGCLGFGVCWALAQGRWSPLVGAAVFVGFFGGFTTFSSFAFDCHELWVARRFALFALDVVGQNVLGLAAIAVGLWLGGLFRGD